MLTMMVLLGFATVIGTVTTQRIRSDFQQQLDFAANDLANQLEFHLGETLVCLPSLDTYASPEHAVIRVVNSSGQVLCSTSRAPDLGPPVLGGSRTGDYRVQTRVGPQLMSGWPTYVQYARPYSVVERSVDRVRLFLLFGVLGGLVLALLAGLAIARRAMQPIAQLTTTAREIARTRDPSIKLPHPEANDEVAELARTLEGMLRALDGAREETEGMLARQRQFVADASHELRTPLTSVLANLELLAEELDGEAAEAAQAALRSSQRMRRLVADLLLLARADVGRRMPREPTDLGAVVVEAAAELEPVASDHELEVDARPAVVDGAPDEIHRLVLNLIENAVRHTPPGTRVRATVAPSNGCVRLVVDDDGPGVPEELRERIFDRFVRGGGDRGGGTGLGLAIVRAVAESHGGSVSLTSGRDGADGGARSDEDAPAAEDVPAAEAPLGGARFVVMLPAARQAATPEEAAATEAPRS